MDYFILRLEPMLAKMHASSYKSVLLHFILCCVFVSYRRMLIIIR